MGEGRATTSSPLLGEPGLFLAENRCHPTRDVRRFNALAVATKVEGLGVVRADKGDVVIGLDFRVHRQAPEVRVDQ